MIILFYVRQPRKRAAHRSASQRGRELTARTLRTPAPASSRASSPGSRNGTSHDLPASAERSTPRRAVARLQKKKSWPWSLVQHAACMALLKTPRHRPPSGEEDRDEGGLQAPLPQNHTHGALPAPAPAPPWLSLWLSHSLPLSAGRSPSRGCRSPPGTGSVSSSRSTVYTRHQLSRAPRVPIKRD